jgi:hypothetical protein
MDEASVPLRRNRKSVWHADAGAAQLSKELSEGRIFTAHTRDVIDADVAEPPNKRHMT